MIFDTDVLIWAQRGNLKAARVIDNAEQRAISIQTYMELLQCAETKEQHKIIKHSLHVLGFEVLPLTQNIGHRAAVYIEEYTMAYGLMAADAIIAATAIENSLSLVSGNKKHFKCIKELDFQEFKPS